MGEHEITQFISYPAVKMNVAPGTQNQALKAIVFIYKQALRMEKIKILPERDLKRGVGKMYQQP